MTTNPYTSLTTKNEMKQPNPPSLQTKLNNLPKPYQKFYILPEIIKNIEHYDEKIGKKCIEQSLHYLNAMVIDSHPFLNYLNEQEYDEAANYLNHTITHYILNISRYNIKRKRSQNE